jgi:hypothetical protein
VIDLFQQVIDYTIEVTVDGAKRYVEETVSALSWGGSRDTATRSLKFTVQNHEGLNDFEPRHYVVLRNADGEEIFSGIITKRSKNSNGSISYTAYDCRWYLAKNKHDKIYRNMSASEILTDIFINYGIPYGDIVNTGVKFPAIHIENKTLWDTALIALTETTKITGVKYVTKVVDGKVVLVEKKTQLRRWVIEQGQNLIESSYEDSMENMYTQVYASGKDKDSKPLSAVAKDEAAQAKYGVMQEYISQSEETTAEELNQIATQKLRELAQLERNGKVTTIGIDSVTSGDAIYVVDEVTGLVGGFYVLSDDHTVSNRNHTMQLSLSWSDEVATLEYEPPKEDKG